MSAPDSHATSPLPTLEASPLGVVPSTKGVVAHELGHEHTSK